MTVTGAKQPLNVQKNSSGFNRRRWFYKDDCERKVKKFTHMIHQVRKNIPTLAKKKKKALHSLTVHLIEVVGTYF